MLLFKGKSFKTRNKKVSRAERLNGVEIPSEASRHLKELSIKCMLELLVTHPHFNYRREVISVAIPHITDRQHTVSEYITAQSDTLAKYQ